MLTARKIFIVSLVANDTSTSDNITWKRRNRSRAFAGDELGIENRSRRTGWRGMKTASLNNILRQCKERLLGHYRWWLTILAIWLGQCYVSDFDSLPPVLRLFPLSSLAESISTNFRPSYPFLPRVKKICIVTIKCSLVNQIL